MSIRTSISAFHHRSVRRRHALELLAYSGGIVVLLLLLSAWICAQGRAAPPPYYWDPHVHVDPLPWNELALADLFAVGLLSLTLFVLAPAAVAATVAGERRTGTLDQLRTTPLDPLALVAGLVVGAPARFYLLCAGPLALHVIAALAGVVPFDAMVASVVILGVGGLASALFALTFALAPRQDTGGAFVALGVAAVLGTSGFISMVFASDRSASHWAFLHPAGALNASYLAFDGLWRHLTTSFWSLEKFNEVAYTGTLAMVPFACVLFVGTAGLVLARAACRKLAAPHLPLFGKLQAVGLFTLVSAALIVPFEVSSRSSREAGMVPLVFGLFLLPAVITIGLFATPAFESWALSLRGRRRPGAWSDGAAPHAAVWTMLGVYLAMVFVRLHAVGFPLLMRDRHVLSFGWGCYIAATMPLFMLFAATRFTSPGARWAFGAAIGAHLLFQIIGIAMVTDGSLGATERTIVEMAALCGVAVPAWIVWRQQALRRRILAGDQL
jgi:hypothetical protein